MRACRTLALCLAAMIAGPPAHANRLTFEVWPDASPDHAVFCTFAPEAATGVTALPDDRQGRRPAQSDREDRR